MKKKDSEKEKQHFTEKGTKVNPTNRLVQVQNDINHIFERAAEGNCHKQREPAEGER